MPWHFTWLGYQLGFAQPLYLGLVAVAAALGTLSVWIFANRRRRLRAALPERFHPTLAPGVSVGLPVVRSVNFGLALVLFAVALAQPQCGSHSELVKRRGIDVVVALDASKSMLARDVTPSRLERAKLELQTLLEQLKGDRVAIVAFAGEAYVQCPLTSDYAAAKIFLRAIDPEVMPQGGTNIGEALTLAKKALESADRGAKARVIVLLSDGEDLTGEVQEAVDGLKEAGVTVFAVGIGSDQGEPIPLVNRHGEVVGYKKDEGGATVLTKLDRAGLTALAEATGGEFFWQPKGVAMSQVSLRIDAMQKSELESRLMVQYSEGFQLFLGAGLFFFALGVLVLPSWRWRRA